MRAMATLHFDLQHLDAQTRQALGALVPKEQEHIQELMKKGIVEAIYISEDRSTVWLVMKGEALEQLQQELTTFPLYPYMKPAWAPLV